MTSHLRQVFFRDIARQI